MLGHHLPGVRGHYLLFDASDFVGRNCRMLKVTINAIDALTINEENRLKKENQGANKTR